MPAPSIVFVKCWNSSEEFKNVEMKFLFKSVSKVKFNLCPYFTNPNHTQIQHPIREERKVQRGVTERQFVGACSLVSKSNLGRSSPASALSTWFDLFLTAPPKRLTPLVTISGLSLLSTPSLAPSHTLQWVAQQHAPKHVPQRCPNQRAQNPNHLPICKYSI